MSDHSDNLVWIDITSDFEPVEYAKTFAESDVVDAINEASSLEAQLLCLYENGYLSKRDGKIQYLLPEELTEVMKGYKRARAAGAGRMASLKRGVTGVGKSLRYSKAGQKATEYATKGAKMAKAHPGKAAGVAAGAVGAGLAARALYKKMKSRKKKNENLNDQDIEFLVNEAELLGFEFENLEDLGEAIDFGAYIDGVLTDAADEGLTEDYSEEDIIEATLDELEEAGYGPKEKWSAYAKRMPGRASKMAKPAMAAGAAKAKEYGSKGLSMAKAHKGKLAVGAGVAGAGLAARALYKRMKAKKAKKESLGETLTAEDLNEIVAEAQQLGFDLTSYDELIEALKVGELVNDGFDFYADNGLSEATEDDVMDAILNDLDEGWKERLGGLKAKAAGWSKTGAKKLKSSGKAAWGGAKKAGAYAKGKGHAAMTLAKKHPKKAAGVAAGAAAVGAGAYVMNKYRKKKKAKNESQEFTGYRSSAQGGLYENAPIPYGTGNNLYEKIQGLLKTDDGQEIIKNL